MDLSKRKLSSDDSPNGNGDRRKQRRSIGDEKPRQIDDRDRGGAVVNDAEVEEFYAILQRMRATRCVGVGGIAVSNGVTKAERLRWRPKFVREDFEGSGDGVKDSGGVGGEVVSGEDKEGEVRVRGLELDLNADPEPEGGDCTARSCAQVQA